MSEPAAAPSLEVDLYCSACERRLGRVIIGRADTVEIEVQSRPRIRLMHEDGSAETLQPGPRPNGGQLLDWGPGDVPLSDLPRRGWGAICPRHRERWIEGAAVADAVKAAMASGRSQRVNVERDKSIDEPSNLPG